MTEFSVSPTTNILSKNPDSKDFPCREGGQWKTEIRAFSFFFLFAFCRLILSFLYLKVKNAYLYFNKYVIDFR